MAATRTTSTMSSLFLPYGEGLLPPSLPAETRPETEPEKEVALEAPSASAPPLSPQVDSTLPQTIVDTLLRSIEIMEKRSFFLAKVSFTTAPELTALSPSEENLSLSDDIVSPSASASASFHPPLFVKRGISHEEIWKTMRAAELGIGPHIYLTHSSKTGAFFWVMKAYDRDLFSLAIDASIGFKERLSIGAKFTQLISDCHREIGPHNDLKPENAVISHENGEVRLIDFPPSQITGTMGYFSPERARARYHHIYSSEEELLADDTYATALSFFAILTGSGIDNRYTQLPNSNETLAMLISARKSHAKMVELMSSTLSKIQRVPNNYKRKIIDVLSDAFKSVTDGRINSEMLAERVQSMWREVVAEEAFRPPISETSETPASA